MKRALLPVIVVASLSLTACSKAAPQAQVATPSPSSAPVEAQTTTPTAPATGTADSSQPAPAPAVTTTTGTAPATAPVAGQSGQNAVSKVDAKPAIKWYPKGIGLPLVSDDPAAQGKKVVMLTFDDGPSNTGTTARILDTLKAENVKVMFCITGYGAKNIDLVKREIAEGHTLEPHTQTHPDLTTLSVQGMKDEIQPTYDLITQLTGQKPKWLRPPFGSYNHTLIDLAKNDYGMGILNWSDGSLDWDGLKDGYKDPQVVINDVMKQLHPGAVVLMHDTNRHTADALPELIHRIRAEGYEFVVMTNDN